MNGSLNQILQEPIFYLTSRIPLRSSPRPKQNIPISLQHRLSPERNLGPNHRQQFLPKLMVEPKDKCKKSPPILCFQIQGRNHTPNQQQLQVIDALVVEIEQSERLAEHAHPVHVHLLLERERPRQQERETLRNQRLPSRQILLPPFLAQTLNRRRQRRFRLENDQIIVQRLNAGKQIREQERFSWVRNAEQSNVSENFEAREKSMFIVDGFSLGAAGGSSAALGGRAVRGARDLRGVGP